ncbi:MAG: tyrosine-protein phosphatase [Clostridiales bacterium]|nr:tyrosine-protein phosphatase [Clostridiales bacterium]
MIKYKRVPLETMVNVRDLGGYAAMDGRVTRYGKFLRADCPIGISENDIRFLKEYGISLSIDLRGSDETLKMPSGLNGTQGHTYRHCPAMIDRPTPHIIRSADKTAKNGSKASLTAEDNFDLGDSYIDIAESAKIWIKQVFELCAGWEGGVIYHCYLGKDRAGIISAMLLGVCGVTETDIIMDYCASMVCLRPKYERMNPVFLPTIRERPDYKWGFFGSVPESMEALLRHITEKYGSVSSYLTDCGVTDKAINRLKDKLLEETK